MRINLPNSANLQNITGLLRLWDLTEPEVLEFSMHPKWVAVHPVVLAMVACLGARVRRLRGSVVGFATQVPTIAYLIRMGLFDYVGVDPGKNIISHEQSGRFVPLTQVKTNDDLKRVILDLVPLLHAPSAVADPIRYVFSEMVRNSLEHSFSQDGVFVCAQYYRQSSRIAIGIADTGDGILKSTRRSHQLDSCRNAIHMALQPGITGVTRRIGGNETNAGAGLFFTKSIYVMSRNRFVLYSGDSMFRLMQTRERDEPRLYADPSFDPHTYVDAPNWPGTVVGIDLSIERGIEFAALLQLIKSAYHLDVKQKKNYASKIRFS